MAFDAEDKVGTHAIVAGGGSVVRLYVPTVLVLISFSACRSSVS